MMNFKWKQLVLVAAIVTSAVVAQDDKEDFWKGKCGKLKGKMAANQEISDENGVESCVRVCIEKTASPWYTVTPEECFNDLLVPFLTKVLKQQIPTDDEIKNCLITEDRSKCEYTLLYYFAKWYKEKYSADHNKAFAIMLYSSWLYIPDVFPGFTYSTWWTNPADELGSVLKRLTDQDVQEALKVTSVSDPVEFPVIHRELRRYCDKPNSGGNFRIEVYCWLRTIMNIALKIRTLVKHKQEYSEDFQKYIDALKSNIVALDSISRWLHEASRKQKAILLDQELDELTTLTRAGNTENLQKYVQFVPEPYLLEKACKGRYQMLTRRCCILEKVVEQLVTYSNMVQRRKNSSKRKAVTINLSLNVRTVISERRGEEILKVLIDWRYQDLLNQENTASLIEGKFGQLQSYFLKLQSFNMQKANADVGYVKGRIQYYEGKTGTAITDVSEQVGGILRGALITQGLEVGEKVIKLTFAIVEACNPFKAVFNGGTASDILDATAELMKAIAGLTEAIALKNAWNDVISTAREISAGFQKNSEFLSAVGRIVEKVKLTDFPSDEEFEKCKSTFLRLYNEYTPKVDKQMLEIFATRMETSVTSGCILINEVTGAAANGYVAYVKSNLYCQKASATITGLKTIFDEIYDFQFEFIENMASYLRSATGYQASQQMVTLSAKPLTSDVDIDEQRRQLRATIIMAHITYEMQKESAIQNLCDFLEYKEGGNTPTACKATNIDVPTLLSYIPKRCRSYNTYVSIPTTTLTKIPAGHINLEKLYHGEDVSFDIPDYNWMKQKNWIGKSDDFAAVFIRSFEIFLPTINPGKEKIEMTAKPMGGNIFPTKTTKYTLIPSNSFTTVYTGGRRFQLCSGRKIENPYTICEDRKLPKLCVMSDVPSYDDETLLYPTAFARFKITAKGISPSLTPDPETALDVKAKVNMCILDKGKKGRKRTRRSLKPGCCSGNNYWNEKQSACQLCANGSTANMNGYYCEKNQDAISQRKNK